MSAKTKTVTVFLTLFSSNHELCWDGWFIFQATCTLGLQKELNQKHPYCICRIFSYSYSYSLHWPIHYSASIYLHRVFKKRPTFSIEPLPFFTLESRTSLSTGLLNILISHQRTCSHVSNTCHGIIMPYCSICGSCEELRSCLAWNPPSLVHWLYVGHSLVYLTLRFTTLTIIPPANLHRMR